MSDVQARVAETVCRSLHPTRWEYHASPCEPCTHVAAMLAEAGLLSDRPDYIWARHRKAELSKALGERDAALALLAEAMNEGRAKCAAAWEDGHGAATLCECPMGPHIERAHPNPYRITE